MYNVEEVGARLKGLREDKRMSQYELADAIGISRESIARYETGKRGITVEVLDIYSNYFNVSVEYIMYGTDENIKMDGELQKIVMMIGEVPDELRNAIETMLVMYNKK